jgi:hypothetical protein
VGGFLYFCCRIVSPEEEKRFAALAQKQGFKTLSPAEMQELKALADKKANETKQIRRRRKPL